MNLSELLDKYSRMPEITGLAESLKAGTLRSLYLRNLKGSSAEFVISSLFLNKNNRDLNHLIVLDDAEEAAYFQNTLESLTGALDIFYFPSSFKTRNNFKILNPSHVMLRAEALSKIASGGNHKIVVTYPEALAEKVVLSQSLKASIIELRLNEEIEPEKIMKELVDVGFFRVDFVYEPGQFAFRGGILDIYSFGNEKPYRVELFGNEVDSIRLFDPQSQLSERKLNSVRIIPNIDMHFQNTEKVSLLAFMPPSTVIWLKNWDIIEKKIRETINNLQSFLIRVKDNPQEFVIVDDDDASRYLPEVSQMDFLEPSNMLSEFTKHALFEFGLSKIFANDEVSFETKMQPVLNRQFNLLIDDLKAHEKEGYEICIFAEQPRQLERLRSIFEDLNTEIRFSPIPVSIHEGFIDERQKLLCYTDHQIFQRYQKYHLKEAFSKGKAMTMKLLRDLQPGDFVVHIDHGIGVYSGLEKIPVEGKMQEAVRIIYKDNDILYVNINSLHKISKYSGKEGTLPKINKLGSEAWSKLKSKTKSHVKEVAFSLIKLYAARRAEKGFAHSPDNYLQTELEASFMYEDTPDQSKSTLDMKKDMESPVPMDRLICGDVGFGKTEIAIRAAFKTCCDGKQAVILVPTTILAMQHYETFRQRLKDLPVTVDYLNRFKQAKQKKETLQRLEEGKIDIIIGTHGLFAKSVKFHDLGLIVVDEEQKFGVAHKEKLKTLKTNVDCLTLTATPIPRTLQFSLMGARDLSIINTPPPNRQPIQTELHVFSEDFIRDAVYYEMERGGQVFFIQNRIQGLSEIADLIKTLCPDLEVGIAHGKLEGPILEKRVMDFIDHKYDVLVCTNIVESGVDIPNVNTIIVNNAHQFGLSDLHQLRGRVGRSNKKAFCYLISPPLNTLPSDSRKRLQTLEQFSDLGSGFQIAMRDLDIRGAGNLLGGEQSGFMAQIGFDMYQKILDETIRELKQTEFKDLFKDQIRSDETYVSDCTIDTDLEILIPDAYVENISERLSLYSRLNNCKTDNDLNEFHAELIDRFGPVPDCVEDLFLTVKTRWIGLKLGFEKMVLKKSTLRCYFINSPDSLYFESPLFRSLIKYIQQYTNNTRLKQVGRNFILIVSNINDMKQFYEFIQKMESQCVVDSLV